VGGEYSPEFLLYEVGRFRSQAAPAEQVDLDFPERGLNFPTLVVGGGELDRAGLIGIKNRGDQPERLGCAVGGGVAMDLVLDDPDRDVGGQVRLAGTEDSGIRVALERDDLLLISAR